MTSYIAPLRDMKFLIEKVFCIYQLYEQLPSMEQVSPEIVNAILEQMGKFTSEEMHPINRLGHEEGCHLEDGNVITPKCFKPAFQKFIDAGWTQLSESPEYGGQGLPYLLTGLLGEMNLSANTAMGFYLSRDGSVATIENNAPEDLKNKFLPNLIKGIWGGPMCLTEPHCGSDLGLIKTKAELQSDGNYKITGTKMFITGGDNDLVENNINLVLARLPDSPDGIKGISLFIVPKILLKDDGSLGAKNKVHCGSIEHKMGLNASATCVMNFDGATGYLIGEINKGMRAMFTMVNRSRYMIGQQGTALAEVAYQNAVNYANERLQMRALTGPQSPELPADPIIVHPDVRRMLLTQRAFIEGSRALNNYIGCLFDELKYTENPERKQSCQSLLDLLTPICKGFNSEMGFESVNLALQTYGGHGYIRENGMEQFVRDARAAQIYEGTTGIQGIDLLGRKVLANGGQTLGIFIREIKQFCSAQQNNEQMSEFISPLLKAVSEWTELTAEIGSSVMDNPNELGAASVDYLMYSGYVTLAYFWAKMAAAALQYNDEDTRFYQAKLQTARFYYQRMLPRTLTLKATMLSGSNNLMATDADAFIF